MTEETNRAMSFEQSYYENSELWAGDQVSAADQERIATLAAKLPLDVRSLLDVGCGNGLFLQHVSESQGRHYERLCGADRSRAALARVVVENVEASVDLLPFCNHEFDAVSCMEVLEHLPRNIYVKAIDELCRVARRYILVSVPFNENLRQSLSECPKCRCRFNASFHLRAFDKPAMSHLLDEHGFRCREVFFIHKQRVVPSRVETVLRGLGAARRRILRREDSLMPNYTVCPACGYAPATEGHDATTLSQPKSRNMENNIRSLLSISRGWRWLGALYERP